METPNEVTRESIKQYANAADNSSPAHGMVTLYGCTSATTAILGVHEENFWSNLGIAQRF